MLKNNPISENYFIENVVNKIIVSKTEWHNNLYKKISFRITVKEASGLSLNNPQQLFNQISELWQKK
jgi:hypothetical protein